jgi:glycosyltransferase involved in cell wall biosynthesis
MHEPTITFAIPFYNNTIYLRRAIDSVVSQTVDAWRCLVIDDAGPDPEARELVLSYNDPRISYLRAESNGGLAINWNRCLDQATTDLVTLLHADDELLTNYLERMIKLTEDDPLATGYFCEAEIIDQNSEIRFSFPDYVKIWIRPKSDSPLKVSGDSGLSSILKGNYIMCPTIVYRKSQLQALRFSPRWKMVLDLDMYINIISRGGHLLGAKDILYRYRRHEANQTAQLTASNIRFHEEIQIYDETIGLADNMGWNQSAGVARKKRIIKLNLIYQILVTALGLRLNSCHQFAKVLLEGFKS